MQLPQQQRHVGSMQGSWHALMNQKRLEVPLALSMTGLLGVCGT
jgi:hypothetical protein